MNHRKLLDRAGIEFCNSRVKNDSLIRQTSSKSEKLLDLLCDNGEMDSTFFSILFLDGPFINASLLRIVDICFLRATQPFLRLEHEPRVTWQI